MEDSGYSLFYKSQQSEFGCFYVGYNYHYCYVAVCQSHLYGHLVLIAELAEEFCWSYLMF